MSVKRYEAREQEEFLTPVSPENLVVRRVTGDDDRAAAAFYQDVPSWSPDSRRFVFKRAAAPDGSEPPGVWMCDLDDDFSVRPVCEFPNGLHPAGGPDMPDGASYGAVFSPLGDALYEMIRKADMVEVVRIDIASGERAPVCSAPNPFRSRGQHSLSGDGARLCMGNFLGDGETEGAPWGAYVFELATGEWRTVEFGNGYRNMHCCYSPNAEAPLSHRILLCAGRGKLADGTWLTPADGSWRHAGDRPFSEEAKKSMAGGIHIVDDATGEWWMIPVGEPPEDGKKRITGGHHVWRGVHGTVVSQVYESSPERWRSGFWEFEPVPVEDEEEKWLGARHPKANGLDLTRNLSRADGCHFSFDRSGLHMVADSECYGNPMTCMVYTGVYVEPKDGRPYLKTRYLLIPRTSWSSDQATHPHPCVSPDGRTVVVQSDFFGAPQILAATDYEYA